MINEAKKLLPKSNYVGFSITQGNEYRKKSWSIYKFISLANKSLIKNKIPVFFIEKNQEHIIEKIKNQVPGSLFPETNSELSCPALVTALSSRLDQAVSIDNGVMHMMGLSDIPMVILFGPTNSDKFAPKNNYTKILDSKNFGIDFNKCIDDKKIEDYVLENRIEGVKKFKINATPTIIINGEKFNKPLTFKNLKKFLEKLI